MKKYPVRPLFFISYPTALRAPSLIATAPMNVALCAQRLIYKYTERVCVMWRFLISARFVVDTLCVDRDFRTIRSHSSHPASDKQNDKCYYFLSQRRCSFCSVRQCVQQVRRRVASVNGVGVSVCVRARVLLSCTCLTAISDQSAWLALSAWNN